MAERAGMMMSRRRLIQTSTAGCDGKHWSHKKGAGRGPDADWCEKTQSAAARVCAGGAGGGGAANESNVWMFGGVCWGEDCFDLAGPAEVSERQWGVDCDDTRTS